MHWKSFMAVISKWFAFTKRNDLHNVSLQCFSLPPSNSFTENFLMIICFSFNFNRKRIFEKNGKLSKSKLVLLKRIELNLYASASSFEEYADISTLKERIVAVAKKRCISPDMSVEKPWNERMEEILVHTSMVSLFIENIIDSHPK